MARTWISNAHGLRISKPGVEVTTATEQQLQFTSERSLPWLWFSGSANLAAGQTGTLTYPSTLTMPARIDAAIRLTGGGKRLVGTGQLNINFATGIATVAAQVRSYLDRMEIYNGYATSVTVDYAGWRLT